MPGEDGISPVARVGHEAGPTFCGVPVPLDAYRAQASTMTVEDLDDVRRAAERWANDADAEISTFAAEILEIVEDEIGSRWALTCRSCDGSGRIVKSRYGGNDPNVWEVACSDCSGPDPDVLREDRSASHEEAA
jgi:hypothetical protein